MPRAIVLKRRPRHGCYDNLNLGRVVDLQSPTGPSMAAKLLFRWMFWCLLLVAQGQSAYAVLAECVLPARGLSLAATLSSLGDPDLAVSLDSARARYAAGAFQQHRNGMPSFGFIQGALWAHVQLPAVDEACTELLVLEQPRVNTVDLFVLQPDTTVVSLRMGAALPFNTRALAHRFPNVRITRQAGPPVDVFIRVQSSVSVQLPLMLYTEAALFHGSHNEQAGMGLYYGLLLALLLYSIAVTVGIRDASYFYYVLYLAALGLFSLNFNGFGAQYLWPDTTHWQVSALPLSFGALVVFGGLFARNFLDLAHTAPLVGRLLMATVVLAIAASLVGAFQLAPMPATLALTAMVLAGSVLITVGGVLSAARGYRPARYFLLAWCLQLLGGIAVPLSAFGWIPRTLASEYGLQIGSAAEMMLLSFALVYRINLLRDKKDQAEREALQEAGRLHLEQSLQRSLQERNTILDNALVAIIFLNGQGRLQWANQATYKMFGMSPGQGIGESITSLYPSHEDYLAVDRALTEASNKGQAFEDKRWMRHSNGELIWVYTSARTVNPTDASQGTVLAVMDITKHRQLEENLRRTEEQYRLVVENVSEGMVVVQNGRFIFANPALLSLTGYSAAEILGQEFLPLVYTDDREFFLANHASRMRGEAFESKYDFRALHKSGQLIWVHIATVVVQWDGQPAMLSFISDITQRKQAEEDIRASLEKQRELNGMKSRFVAVTSHEFRTPLSTILLSAELLKYYSDKLSMEERTPLLENIETAVARMKHMIDDILLIGKSDADKLEFDPQPLALRAFCESLVDDSRASLNAEAAAKLAIDFRMTGDTSDAKFDEKLLRQIFSNLLSNAIKYSPNGGRVFFGVACRADEVEFHVADQGIGMPKEDVARLFETFYRASNVGTISGTGLGLSIVRRAVKLHGGTIKVDSVLGTGTRFIVNLPRVG